MISLAPTASRALWTWASSSRIRGPTRSSTRSRRSSASRRAPRAGRSAPRSATTTGTRAARAPRSGTASARTLRASSWTSCPSPTRLSRTSSRPVEYWLTTLGYSDEFAAKVLSPTLTLLVVTRAGLLSAPIVNILGLFSDKQLSFFNGTLWRLFPGGTRQYVDALVANTPGTFLKDTPVTSVSRTPSGVLVTDGKGKTERFDQVVFGTQANITLRLLADATPEEKALLGAFTWQQADVYLHSDDSVLSKVLPKDLCSQYHYDGPNPEPELQGSFTLNMGVGLGLPHSAGPVLITGYNIDSKAKRPHHNKIVAQARWEHELATLEQTGARQMLHTIQGQNNTWHCGTTAVWASADAVLASGMVVATKVSPAAQLPFTDPASVADFQQIEAVMFPPADAAAAAVPSPMEGAPPDAEAPSKPAIKAQKPGFRRVT